MRGVQDEDVDRRLGRIEALFEAEYRPMVRLAFTLVGNIEEAEELVQDGFTEVHRRLDELDRPGAYLRTAVISRSRSVLRHRRVAQTHAPRLSAADPTRRPEDLPASAAELWDVLNKLTEDQRTSIILRYYGQYRASEIADLMELPAATVRSHLRRGLIALRRELDR